MKRILLLLLLAHHMQSPQAQTPGLGLAKVDGVVLTAEGTPLPGALVDFWPLDRLYIGGRPQAVSGADGKFTLQVPTLGLVRINAKLPEAGYPDTEFRFFADTPAHFPEVRLDSERDAAHVVIRMPPPDGVVRMQVVDAISGQPVPGSTTVLSWSDQPSVYVRVSQHASAFFFAVPGRAVRIQVSAAGYAPWEYSEEKGRGALLLPSGQEKQLVVRLRPTASQR